MYDFNSILEHRTGTGSTGTFGGGPNTGTFEMETYDIVGYEALECIAEVLALNFDPDTKIWISFLDSDDNISFDAVSDEFMSGTQEGATIDGSVATLSASSSIRRGYIGSRRYAKLLINFENANNATNVNSVGILMKKRKSPTPFGISTG